MTQSINSWLRLIEYALQTQKGFGLVIIDGIRDLMLDINNPSESVHIINKLMQWSSRYDLHIHCVLHLNKGDDNVRGHIGTELSNKAELVVMGVIDMRKESDPYLRLGKIFDRVTGIIGVAGSMKAASLSEEEKKAAVKDFNFPKGLAIALLGVIPITYQ